MFEDPGCKWWRINNHTDYLVGHHEDNVRDHATILGKYIEGLVYLEQLYINSFFINLDSVFRHRLEHRQYHPRGHHDRTNPVDGVMMHNALHLAALAPEGAPPINPNMPLLADKILWSSSCPQCEYELQDSVGNAEANRAERVDGAT
ncbi:hypothetical protein RhiXN_04537 [Rhizoctonia solani]|uniref:Uncharacterized protein n=1 Tax=Rhizoctonia solani TaxID=456999 RepID=A0A8H8NQD0_9AGAM|nr:uncharacterized protein RhiXN_04537 [Rhizoctonia solani]QRW16536.1 hypothetical protein RhiXN_04537 [Rhizoctonia solani]